VTRYDEYTALLVVDVQNDFADPRGNLYVRGGEEIVPVVNGEVRVALEQGAKVVYTQDWHPPVTPHFEKDGGTWPLHCVAGTWGAELHPALVVEGEKVRKGAGGEDGYSGFTVADPTTAETASTGLEQILREQDVQRVVVVGLALDVCVKATALDAVGLGFATEVSTAATRPVELAEGDGERALAEMRDAGVDLT
jgi:nicotinamidase/pyrazinamidase